MNTNYDTRTNAAAFVQLPKTAALLADLIGRNATLKLCSAVKHRQLYVPITKSRGEWIAQLVGQDQFAVLHHHFAGQIIKLARCVNIGRAERCALIRREFVTGIPCRKISEEYHIRMRTVQYIVAPLRSSRSTRNCLTWRSHPERQEKSTLETVSQNR